MHLVDIRPKGVVNSASQTERFYRCRRRWALEKIFGVQTPQHPSAQLGTEVHTVLENWLKHATPPDKSTKAGRIAARMIRHLPPPGTGKTERKFHFITDAGIAFTGYIDWSGIFEEWPTVIDHKTTGNLDADYVKTELSLPYDVQALTYTVAGCLGFQVDNIQLLWNYASTKNNDTKPVRARTYYDIVRKQFSEVIDPICAEIVWHTENPADHPSQYPGNPDACGDFGGCPHQQLGLCQFTQEERIRSAMTQPPTLAARLAGPQFAPPGNGAGGGFAPPAIGGGFGPPAGGGFAPPGGMHFGNPPPAAPPQPQTAPVQGGFVPPTAPPQFQQPQVAPPGQQPLVYPPEMAPNPPESGMQAPQVAQEGGKGKRGRGRPPKDKTQEAAPTQTVSIQGPSVEQDVYLRAMTAFMAHPKWDGTPEQLHWAGSMAVNTFRAAFAPQG